VESELAELNEEQFRANRFELVSRLADDLAHEIKNPLNSIVINLEVLKVRAAKGEPAGVIDRAVVIDQEVRRLHDLVDRLLLLIRPEREEASNLPVRSALDELVPLIAAQTRLARNDFQGECLSEAFIAARRDVFKFALLNVFAAVHDRLGEGGGTLAFRCATSPDAVALIIEAAPSPGGPSLRAPEAPFTHALDVAAALLAPSGGRIEWEGGSVTVIVPRAAAV
jgi:signal transduction histidine kinase